MNLKGIGGGNQFLVGGSMFHQHAAKELSLLGVMPGPHPQHRLSPLVLAVHQISMCSCSPKGSCNKSHTRSSIRWYLPFSIPSLAVPISRLQREARDRSFYFLDRHLTCGCSCLGNASQVRPKIQLREKKGLIRKVLVLLLWFHFG